MGFLSQVPLSARFLLYRAVRGGFAPLRQGRASATQQNVYSPCGLAGQTTAAKDLPLPPNFRARWRGGIFLLTPGPTSIRKVHPGFRRKNAAAARVSARPPTTVNGHSIFEKRYTESFAPTVQQAIRAFCRLCLFLFQSPAFSFRQG